MGVVFRYAALTAWAFPWAAGRYQAGPESLRDVRGNKFVRGDKNAQLFWGAAKWPYFRSLLPSGTSKACAVLQSNSTETDGPDLPANLLGEISQTLSSG
jgi:hypothetical protein